MLSVTTAPSSTHPQVTLPTRESVRKQLLAGQFAEVDALLSGVQSAFERGELPDLEAAKAWNAFSGYRPDLTKPLERWVKAFPRSYAAQLALGMHQRAHGARLRTQRRAHAVPPARWQKIANLFSAAQGHLSQALALTSQPFTAYSTLISMGMTFSQDTWALYREGVARCPSSLLLRRAQLASLRTEWGGSVEEMYAFLERPEHSSLPDVGRAYLRALTLNYEGHHLAHFQRQPEKAEQKYRTALTAHELAAPLNALIRSASSPQEVESLTRRSFALDPEDDNTHLALFFFYRWHVVRPRTALHHLHTARA